MLSWDIEMEEKIAEWLMIEAKDKMFCNILHDEIREPLGWENHWAFAGQMENAQMALL